MKQTMKTFFIWMMAAVCVCINVTAQGFGGGYGGGGRGGFGGGGGHNGGGRGGHYGGQRIQSQSTSQDYSQLKIINFPEITGLTLNQDLVVSTAVLNEQKDMLKTKDQKQEMQVKIDHAGSQKDIDKYTQKMAKLDDKMQQVSLKADTKIRSILTNEQYQEFTEKKDQIKFGFIPQFGNGFRPTNSPDGDNPEGRERMRNDN